jgi:23S rRNA (cytosine1962-C5)-methyltransferase
VTAIDQSAPALEAAQESLALCGLPPRVDWVCGNVFDELRRFEEEQRTFDVVVVDPPPFAPSRRQVDSARRGYKDLALRAMRLLRSGGTLLFFSCSHAFSRQSLLEVLHEAARDAKRSLRVVTELHQPPDHPVLPQVPETDYLKGFALEVSM